MHGRAAVSPHPPNLVVGRLDDGRGESIDRAGDRDRRASIQYEDMQVSCPLVTARRVAYVSHTADSVAARVLKPFISLVVHSDVFVEDPSGRDFYVSMLQD